MSRTRRRRAAVKRWLSWFSRDGHDIECRAERDAAPYLGEVRIARGCEYVVRDGHGVMAWSQRSPDWIVSREWWGQLNQSWPKPLPGTVRGKLVRRSNKPRQPA